MPGRMRMLGFLAAVVCTLAPEGCKDQEKEKALLEAEQARAELNKSKGDLARTRRELADLKQELEAAKETRDELHLTVEQLIKERTGAAEQTQETVRALTAQSTEQAQSVESLQKEIKQLRTLIETQQALIAEQQATIEQLQKAPEMPAAAAADGEPNKVNEP